MSPIITKDRAICAAITGGAVVALAVAAELAWLWQAGPIRGTLPCGLVLPGLAWPMRHAED